VGGGGLGFVDFKPAVCRGEVLGWVGGGTGAGDGEVCWDGEGRGYECEEDVNECGGIEPAHGCMISSRNSQRAKELKLVVNESTERVNDNSAAQ
jgi:hypothetical protein